MFGTIALGTCISVQGKIVKMSKDGRLTVQVGQKFFTGRSVVPLPGAKPAAQKMPQMMSA